MPKRYDVAGGSRSRAGELTLGLLSGEKRGCSAFDLCCCCPSPQPSPEGEGADFVWFANPEFNSDFHVGVPRLNNSVSPLSLWERARVRVAIWSVFKAVSEFAEPSHKVFRLSVGRAISSLFPSLLISDRE